MSGRASICGGKVADEKFELWNGDGRTGSSKVEGWEGL